MSLGLKVKRRVERSTDPARSLKPIISDETVYDDRRSCPDVFREELFRIDCRVDDVERFHHHLRRRRRNISHDYSHPGNSHIRTERTETKHYIWVARVTTCIQLFLDTKEEQNSKEGGEVSGQASRIVVHSRISEYTEHPHSRIPATTTSTIHLCSSWRGLT